jgi:hypothetical protein
MVKEAEGNKIGEGCDDGSSLACVLSFFLSERIFHP